MKIAHQIGNLIDDMLTTCYFKKISVPAEKWKTVDINKLDLFAKPPLIEN